MNPQTSNVRVRFEDQPTQLRTVDSRTGELLLERPAPEEATRLLPQKPRLCPPPQKKTGEFVPSRGARSTADLTVPWEYEPATSAWKSTLANWGAGMRRAPRRAAAWVGIILGVSLTCAALPRAARLSPRALVQASLPSAVADERPTSFLTAIERVAPEVLGTSEGAQAKRSATPRLAEAVVAVAEGRYDEAIRLYQALHAAAPQDESVALALSILRQATTASGRSEP